MFATVHTGDIIILLNNFINAKGHILGVPVSYQLFANRFDYLGAYSSPVLFRGILFLALLLKRLSR